jgi:hypothetical protein
MHDVFLIKIWSLDHGLRAPSSHIYVEADMFSALTFAHVPMGKCKQCLPISNLYVMSWIALNQMR